MLQVADAIALARQEGNMDPNRLLNKLVDDYDLPRERAEEILRKEGLLPEAFTVHAGAYHYTEQRAFTGAPSSA